MTGSLIDSGSGAAPRLRGPAQRLRDVSGLLHLMDVQLNEATDSRVAWCDGRVGRARDAVFEPQQAALRRVAMLVAGGAASPEMFAAIAEEVARVLGAGLVVIWRYEPERPATVLGAWSDGAHPFQVGTSWPVEDSTAAALLADPGQPSRIEDFGKVGGAIPDAMHETHFRSGTAAAIVVDGEFWGVMGIGVAEGKPLPDQIEDRLAEFTGLVATAISNSTRRAQLAQLADEQAALRRVATLVARGVPPSEVLTAVAREVGLLLGADVTYMARYESDRTATGVAAWSQAGDQIPVGTRGDLEGDSVAGLVLRTGRPARMQGYENARGAWGAVGRELGLCSAVGTPIILDGRLWGVMSAGSTLEQPLPEGTEARLGSFTELLATAIASAEARTELAASRTRIVAATDEERRRVERDLHDGAQQRLVHTVITLKLARRALQGQEGDGPLLVSEALDNAQQAAVELRDLAHGVLPAILRRGGLRAGVDALASRMPVPVDTGVAVGRLPDAVEATAYFVIAEALTNVSKHARAERAAVTARIEEGTLEVRVRDDGVGGARPDGSGLLGLRDRVTARDGRLWVDSPAGGGTLVAADIPVAG
jgi:signal transduction histidine kinase